MILPVATFLKPCLQFARPSLLSRLTLDGKGRGHMRDAVLMQETGKSRAIISYDCFRQTKLCKHRTQFLDDNA